MTSTTRPIPSIMLMDDKQLSVPELVEKWCCQLIQALQFDYDSEHPNNDNYHFSLTTGRKYHKIVNDNGGGIHCFVNKKTGEVFKPASYNKPAKHVRYNLLDDVSRQSMFEKAHYAGGYLYLK